MNLDSEKTAIIIDWLISSAEENLSADVRFSGLIHTVSGILKRTNRPRTYSREKDAASLIKTVVSRAAS